MDPNVAMDHTTNAPEAALRDALERSDAALWAAGPVLAHLLSVPDRSLLTDEIVASVRGMLDHLAEQLLQASLAANPSEENVGFVPGYRENLTEVLQRMPELLGHCHALAVEWVVARRLESERGIDPVLSPILKKAAAMDDPVCARTAMGLISAQARYVQAQRRMELPLAELPGDLLHSVLIAWRRFGADARWGSTEAADASIRGAYDESATRLALSARLVSMMGENVAELLSIEESGAAVFFTALGRMSGQSRHLCVFASHDRRATRMILSLRAAGMGVRDAERVALQVQPGISQLTDLAGIGPEDARTLLDDASFKLGAAR